MSLNQKGANGGISPVWLRNLKDGDDRMDDRIILCNHRLYVSQEGRIIIYNLRSGKVRIYTDDKIWGMMAVSSDYLINGTCERHPDKRKLIWNIEIRDIKGLFIRVIEYGPQIDNIHIDSSRIYVSDFKGELTIYNISCERLTSVDDGGCPNICIFTYKNILFRSCFCGHVYVGEISDDSYIALAEYNFGISCFIYHDGFIYGGGVCLYVFDLLGHLLVEIKTMDHVVSLQIYSGLLYVFEYSYLQIFEISGISSRCIEIHNMSSPEDEDGIWEAYIYSDRIYSRYQDHPMTVHGTYFESDFKKLPPLQKAKISTWTSFCFKRIIHKDIGLLFARVLLE